MRDTKRVGVGAILISTPLLLKGATISKLHELFEYPYSYNPKTDIGKLHIAGVGHVRIQYSKDLRRHIIGLVVESRFERYDALLPYYEVMMTLEAEFGGNK